MCHEMVQLRSNEEVRGRGRAREFTGETVTAWATQVDGVTGLRPLTAIELKGTRVDESKEPVV